MTKKPKANFCPDKDEFYAVYNELGNRDRVAEYYDVSEFYVREFAAKCGYYDSKKIGLSDDDKQYILDNYYNISSNKLAEKFNVKQSYISFLWKRAGLCGKQKRVYSLNEDCFSRITTEEQAYALGFIASDGCVYNSKNPKKQSLVRICISKNDINILKMMNSSVFMSDKPIQIQGEYCSVEYVSDKIVSDLASLGIGERKTYGNTYVELDDNLMRHFIRGYFDGDGSITTTNNKRLSDIHITISGYRSNITKIIAYLNEKNIFSKFVEDKRAYGGNDVFGFLCLTNKTSKYSFLRYAYDDCHIYLERKKLLADDYINRIGKDETISSKIITTYYENAVLKAG